MIKRQNVEELFHFLDSAALPWLGIDHISDLSGQLVTQPIEPRRVREKLVTVFHFFIRDPIHCPDKYIHEGGLFDADTDDGAIDGDGWIFRVSTHR